MGLTTKLGMLHIAPELDILLTVNSPAITHPIESDGARHPPSALADRRAKMFYTVSREYAKIQGLKIRGPAKLLDSRCGNLGLMFAREHGVAAQYLAQIFDAGWPNGWRDFDLEDEAHVEGALGNVCGSAAAAGFPGYIAPGGEGDVALRASMEDAEATGCVGVPHLAWVDASDPSKAFGMFGREHLSLLRRKLHEKGLARREGVAADISHAWEPAPLM